MAERTDACDLSVLSPQQNAGLGAAAGTCQVLILQPLTFWKNAAQQGLPLSINPLVLYRGVFANTMNMAILTGLQFPVAGAIGRVITGGTERELVDAEQIAAALGGGIVSGFVCAPMELIMIQQQRFGTTLLGTTQRVVSEFGCFGSGLYRGLAVSCGREGAFACGCLGVGPALARQFREQPSLRLDPGIAELAGAIAAGILAAIVSHPMDTVKTCMQGDLERTRYGSLPSSARSLFDQGGVGVFFRGLAIRASQYVHFRPTRPSQA